MTTDTQEPTALVQVEEVARQMAPFGAQSEAFAIAQRTAKALASSSIVPEAYKNNVANVMVAMEYANRLGASVLAVMQNLHIIHGKPTLGSSFLIGTVNATNRFTPIRWRWVGEIGKDTRGCYAYATDRESGEVCEGPVITIELAKAEGWYGKSGSKWKTTPDLMLMYRSGAWWTRLYAPEFSLGLHTTDEIEDVEYARVVSDTDGVSDLNASLARKAAGNGAPQTERVPGEDDDRDEAPVLL